MGIQEIERLSDAEKILLVEQIWDSIDKETIDLSDAQKKELDSRLLNHAQGKTQYSSWEEVKQRMRNAG